MQITHTTNTNYIGNPSFEVGVSGWAGRNATLSQTNQQVYTGSYALQVSGYTRQIDTFLAVADYASATGSCSAAITTPLDARSIQVSEQVGVGGTYQVGSGVLQSSLSVVEAAQTGETVAVRPQASSGGSAYLSYPSAAYTMAGMPTGVTYVASAYVYAPAGSTIFIQFFGMNQTGFQEFTATGGWQRVQTSAAANNTQPSFSLQIGVESFGQTFYVDAVQVEANTAPSAYFDGSMGVGYYWTGTANASPSFYRAFEVEAASNSQTQAFGIQVSWTKGSNPTYQPFTIGQSTIGGGDFIPSSNSSIGFFGQYNYTDYSDYGVGFSVQKNIGQYPYGVMIAQASIELDNNTNLFSPGFDPTIGNYILPQRPIILSAGYEDINETVNIFEGLSTAPQSDVNDRKVVLNAYDFVNYASSVKSETTPDQVNQTADQIINALLIEVGFGPDQFVLEPSLQPAIGYFSCYGQVVTDLIQQLCEAEQAIFFCDELGIMHFWNRQHIQTNDTIVWSFNFDTMVDAQQENTPVINDVVVTASPRAVQAKQSLYTLDQPFVIPAAQQVQTGSGTRNMLMNPSFERDINYWSAPSSGAGYNPPNIGRSSTSYTSGATASSYSMSSTGTDQTSAGGTGYSQPRMLIYCNGTTGTGINNPNFNTSTNSSSNYPFVPGQTYTLQGRIKGNAGETGYIGWGWDSNYNNHTEFSGSSQITLTGGWDLISYTWTAMDANGADTYGGTKGGGGGYGGYYYIYFGTSNATGGTAYLDQAMLTEGSTVLTYFDGSTPFNSSDIYQWEGTTSDSSSLMVPINTIAGTYDLSVNFNDPATSVDQLTYHTPLSTTTSSYQTNINADGSGSSYSEWISPINPQLLGGNYKVTFQNAYPEPLYVTALQLFGTPATVVNNITQEYKDSASITKYGVNPANNFTPLSISNDAIQDSSSALSLAYALVLDYKDAYARITTDVIAVPHLQFGDWVTVTFDDTGVTNDYVVVGNTITNNTDEGLTQTLELEIHNQIRYFTIGTSSIGGTDPISP